MSRALPLYVTLSRLSHDSRERLGQERLTVEAIRDAASKAAREGLNSATIVLGKSSLEKTEAASVLMAALKGFTFEWVGGNDIEGQTIHSLRVMWPRQVSDKSGGADGRNLPPPDSRESFS